MTESEVLSVLSSTALSNASARNAGRELVLGLSNLSEEESHLIELSEYGSAELVQETLTKLWDRINKGGDPLDEARIRLLICMLSPSGELDFQVADMMYYWGQALGLEEEFITSVFESAIRSELP
jgi:hypothetical protein